LSACVSSLHGSWTWLARSCMLRCSCTDQYMIV
jgi:hypothetical protein